MASREEVQEYAFRVNKLIDDISAGVAGKVASNEIRGGKNSDLFESYIKSWTDFRVEWRKQFESYKSPGFFSSFDSDITNIKSFHVRALEWKKKWEGLGIEFRDPDAPGGSASPLNTKPIAVPQVPGENPLEPEKAKKDDGGFGLGLAGYIKPLFWSAVVLTGLYIVVPAVGGVVARRRA